MAGKGDGKGSGCGFEGVGWVFEEEGMRSGG